MAPLHLTPNTQLSTLSPSFDTIRGCFNRRKEGTLKTLRSLSAVLGVLVSGAALLAAEKAAEKKDAAPPAGIGKAYEGLEFRNVGPYRGGRVTAVTGVRGQPLVYYFGGTGGGVWKTTDGGSNWSPMSDKDFKTGSVGALGVAESDPNVIYAGMGESPIRGNVSHGDGVYKSTDGGKTLEERRPEEHLPDLARPRSPEEPGPRLRRGAGTRLGPEPGPRDLPLQGRREILGEGLLRVGQDGRFRPLHGSDQPEDPLCGLLAGLPQALDAGVGRPGERHLEIHRRRRHLEEARRRPARGNRRQHRRRRVAGAFRPRLGDRGVQGQGRSVPIRRRRREVDAGQFREPPAPAGLVLHAHLRRPEERRDRFTSSTPASIAPTTGDAPTPASGSRTATTTTSGSTRTTPTG